LFDATGVSSVTEIGVSAGIVTSRNFGSGGVLGSGACAAEDHGALGQPRVLGRPERIWLVGLEAFVRYQPRTLEEAIRLPGVGVVKAQRYLEPFLEAIARWKKPAR